MMAAALVSVLDFQSQCSASLECKRTFYRLKMERNSLKEYSVPAMMSEEEQQALKTCCDELRLRFDANRQWKLL